MPSIQKLILALILLTGIFAFCIWFFYPVRLWFFGIQPKGITIKDQRVYLDGREVLNADPKTFTVLGTGYAKDKNHVYFDVDRIEGVDPQQFRQIDPSDEFAYRDHTRVFMRGRSLEGADPETFRLLGDGIYRDQNFVYWNQESQKQIDVDSFRYLGLGYGKDKRHVFQFGSQGGVSDGKLKIVEDADPGSFELVPGAVPLQSVPHPEINQAPDSRDAKNKYRDGQILK